MEAASRPSPYVPVLVAWLVPGAGHFAIRRTWPGVFVAAAILPLFGTGLVLAGFENVNWDRHPWLFGLQALTGLPAFAAGFLTRTTVPTEPLAHKGVGDLFTCVAGLLNVVAIADVWARCSVGDPEERLEPGHGDDAAPSVERLDGASLLRPDAADASAPPPPPPPPAPPTPERGDE
jgi:hypothetical protein